MSVDRTTDAKTLRAAQRAERLARLRATAVCTVIDNPAPRGLPAASPAIIAGGDYCLEETVADMASPLPELPAPKPPQPRRPSVKPSDVESSHTSQHSITSGNQHSIAPGHVVPSEVVQASTSHPSAASSSPEAPATAPPNDLIAGTFLLSERPLPKIEGASDNGGPATVAPMALSSERVFRLDPPEASPRMPMSMPTFTLAKNEAGAKAAETAARTDGAAKAVPSPYPVGELYRQMRQSVLSQLSTTHGAMVWICPTGSEPLSDHLVELAGALAEGCEGEVLLVDANFHSAALTRRFNLGEKTGLADVLAKKLSPQGAGHETAIARVRVLPKGSDAVGRASRRASEEEWKTLLAGLKERYRYVLIDAPGVEEPHSLPLAKAADATFVAIALDHTPRETVQEALEHLHLHKAHVAGCVITDAPA